MASSMAEGVPFTLYVVRHGERRDFARTGSWDQAWWNENKDARPWDPLLTPSGRIQAGDAGGGLIAPSLPAGALVTVITSPFQRCTETALCLSASLGTSSPPSITVDGALCEFLNPEWFPPHHHALPDFMLGAPELRAALDCHPGIALAAPGSEAALGPFFYPEDEAKLEARADAVASAVLARARAANSPQALVLVTHGGVACAIVSAVLRACEGAQVDKDVPLPHMGYCSVSTLQLQGARLAAPPTLGILPLRLTPSQRWFAPQEHVWRRVVLPALDALKLKSGGKLSLLELGSWEGASASWLLTNACTGHAESSITCVDHFDSLRTPEGVQRAEKFQHNLRLTGLWHKAHTRVDFTVAALGGLLTARKEWDFVYVDASHEAADTLLDAMLAWKGLREGGVVVFDDYLWPEQPVGPLHPKPGIDAFLALHAHELEVMHSGYQVMVKKTVGPRFNF